MEIQIDFTKSAQKNAEEYFEKSKKAKKKADGAEKTIKEFEKRLKNLEKETVKQRKVKKIEKGEWYEKFNWFFASNGMLAVGGRSADQNEELNSKHFESKDLFFHADIFGASVVILKEGVDATIEAKEEAAQFAASFSKAWENLYSSVDVYSLKRDQVTKSSNKGALAKGSFLLSGEREWYRSTSLGLCAFIYVKTGKLVIAPQRTCGMLNVKNYVSISLGRTKKSDAAKFILKALGYDNLDYVMQHLPSGPFSVKEVKGLSL